MAVEKRNPLPVGRYYVAIRAKFIPDFQRFLGIVGRGILVRETKEGIDPFWQNDPLQGATIAYLFDVKNPLIPWDNTKFGWPTIATTAKSISDVEQVPGYERFPSLPDLSSLTGSSIGPLLLLAAAWALSQ